VFVLQLVLFRLGTEKLEKIGFKDKPHGHPGIHGHLSGTGAGDAGFVDATHPADSAAHGHAHVGSDMHKAETGSLASIENSVAYKDASEESPAIAQLLGVATLEFGVIFHRSVQVEAGRARGVSGEWDADGDENGELAMSQSTSSLYTEFAALPHSIIIGLTLAVTGSDEFNVLFVVIIVSRSLALLAHHLLAAGLADPTRSPSQFHQMFEGLGLGTRLAFLQLPTRFRWVPYAGALAYSVVTPLGMAIGLGCRAGLSMSSGSASVAAGVLDAVSGGILIYTATVELIAHEFIFNDFYRRCSWGRLWFSVASFACGAGIMALLGKWA